MFKYFLFWFQILDVSNNPLEILPQVVSALVSLTELYADNIGTVDLEIISPLKHLRKLSLAYNYIDFIPDAFSLLPLTYLDMSGLPFIEKRMSLAAPLLNSFLDKYTVYRRLTAKVTFLIVSLTLIAVLIISLTNLYLFASVLIFK